jgi:hypothetical protein
VWPVSHVPLQATCLAAPPKKPAFRVFSGDICFIGDLQLALFSGHGSHDPKIGIFQVLLSPLTCLTGLRFPQPVKASSTSACAHGIQRVLLACTLTRSHEFFCPYLQLPQINLRFQQESCTFSLLPGTFLNDNNVTGSTTYSQLGGATVSCSFTIRQTRRPSVSPLHYRRDLTCSQTLTGPLPPV